MKELKRISPKAIEQMREILVGSVLGKLKHNQSVFHCGTAHCVAGWNTVLNHNERYTRAERRHRSRTDQVYGWTLPSRGCQSGDWGLANQSGDWGLAKKDWGLNDHEAGYLFQGEASRAMQIGLIEYLADGYRYTGRYRKKGQPKKPSLTSYVQRYIGEKNRIKWAKQYEQPRPNCELVNDLITNRINAKQKERVEEILVPVHVYVEAEK